MNLDIILKLVELFFFMFLGYFLIAVKVVQKEALKHFSNFIFYVTLPALIISTMSKSITIKSEDILIVVIMSFTLYSFLIGMAFILPKILKVDKKYIGLYRFMAIFSNVGFIGFPVIIAVLGPEALFYAAIFNIPYNLLVYSLGVYFITMDTKTKGSIDVKQFLNPGIVATIIGFIVFFTGLQLPSTVTNIAKSLGDITTPLSLIIVGGSLYGVKVKAVLKKHIIFTYSFFKMVLLPTLFAFILSLLDVNSDIAAVVVIIIAMPMAANTVILSQEYDGHVLEASEAVFISTLLLILTLPYIIFLINMLF